MVILTYLDILIWFAIVRSVWFRNQIVKLIATTLSGIVEFENNRRKERQKKGIQAAQKEGKYAGRKTLITKTLINKVKDLKENSNLSVTEISRVIGISRNTIYKVLKEHLDYVSNRLVKQDQK